VAIGVVNKEIGRAIGELGYTKVAEWYDESSAHNIQPTTDVKVGDEIMIKQKLESDIPGACVVDLMKEFIEDNLKGHQVSEKIAQQFGISGVGLRQIDYDVKCYGSLWKNAEITLRYKVEALPSVSGIGIAPIFIVAIVLAVLSLIALGITYYIIKEGGVWIKAAILSASVALLLIAAAFAAVAFVSIFKGIESGKSDKIMQRFIQTKMLEGV